MAPALRPSVAQAVVGRMRISRAIATFAILHPRRLAIRSNLSRRG
jgi:hypothetical protein